MASRERERNVGSVILYILIISKQHRSRIFIVFEIIQWARTHEVALPAINKQLTLRPQPIETSSENFFEPPRRHTHLHRYPSLRVSPIRRMYRRPREISLSRTNETRTEPRRGRSTIAILHGRARSDTQHRKKITNFHVLYGRWPELGRHFVNLVSVLGSSPAALSPAYPQSNARAVLSPPSPRRPPTPSRHLV